MLRVCLHCFLINLRRNLHQKHPVLLVEGRREGEKEGEKEGEGAERGSVEKEGEKMGGRKREKTNNCFSIYPNNKFKENFEIFSITWAVWLDLEEGE